VEACEFRRHFWELQPRIACLLGIEPDHFDCYPTLADAELAYHEFARGVLSVSASHGNFVEGEGTSGTVILRGDCPATRRAVQGLSGRIRTFSLHDPAADWRADPRPEAGGYIPFRLQHGNDVSEEIILRVPGLHNVQNALAAAACAGELGLSLTEIAEGLRQYAGLSRRFEIRKKWRGAVVVDDYAHHPTEIRATLMTARQTYPEKRIVCLFQPHQLSRTSALLTDFSTALSLADRVYLLPVYAAREQAGTEQVRLAQELIQRITVPATLVSTLDQVWGTVQTDADKDAVFLTLGAGSLSRIHHDDIE